MIGRIGTYASYHVCLCYCVLDFAAHSFFSGNDSANEADGFCEEDRYDSLGYGLDFEEFLMSFTIRYRWLFIFCFKEM